jgi:hypothetical protein
MFMSNNPMLASAAATRNEEATATEAHAALIRNLTEAALDTQIDEAINDKLTEWIDSEGFGEVIGKLIEEQFDDDRMLAEKVSEVIDSRVDWETRVNGQVQEYLENSGIIDEAERAAARAAEQAIEDYDFDDDVRDAVISALKEYDLDDAVSSSVDDAVEEAMAEEFENYDVTVDSKIHNEIVDQMKDQLGSLLDDAHALRHAGFFGRLRWLLTGKIA